MWLVHFLHYICCHVQANMLPLTDWSTWSDKNNYNWFNPVDQSGWPHVHFTCLAMLLYTMATCMHPCVVHYKLCYIHHQMNGSTVVTSLINSLRIYACWDNYNCFMINPYLLLEHITTSYSRWKKPSHKMNCYGSYPYSNNSYSSADTIT